MSVDFIRQILTKRVPDKNIRGQCDKIAVVNVLYLRITKKIPHNIDG